MLISLLPVTALAGEAAWNGTTVDTSWYNDSATEFTISDSADLAGLAQLVNEGPDGGSPVSFQGKTIKLSADIDLGGKEWTPIGKSGKPFQGIFDGNEKTISNLVINSPTQSDVGLFGFTQSGEVKNFTLRNAKVSGYLDVGAVAGTPYTSKYTNIAVTGLIQVNGFSYVGGAFGKNAYANLTNVDVTGDEGSYVRAYSIDSAGVWRTYLGGLVGFMGEGNITVSGCNVKIDVTGSTCDIGGILGILHYGNTMTGCTYEGRLTLTDPGDSDDTEFGALTGTVMNSTQKATITDCSATVVQAMKGDQNVTNTITAHGDFYYPLTSSNNATGDVSVSATVNNKPVTVDNYVAKIGDQGYTSLAAAIEAAKTTSSADPVTVTITRSGTYEPFAIDHNSHNGIVVQAADGIEAVIEVDAENRMTLCDDYSLQTPGITFQNITFVSLDGTTILKSHYFGDDGHVFAVQDCKFINKGEAAGAIAVYVDFPNVTIDGCEFENWETAFYTAGEGYAINKMDITGNTYDNVKTIVNGYWQHAPASNGRLTISGNTIDPGTWGTSSIVLWDWAQYQAWLNGSTATVASAIKAVIENNTVTGGDLEYHKIHCDWFTPSDITLPADAKVVDHYLVEINGADVSAVQVYDANGDLVSTMKSENGKNYIYQLPEGEYTFKITQSQTSGDSIISQQTVTVAEPTGEGQTQTITVSPIGETPVAKVGDTEYTSLAEAIQDAKNGGTVELLSNISIDTWKQVWDVENMTIDGNGHTITIGEVESGVNGNYLFYGAEDLNVSDLTINFTTNGSGFSMVSGKLENVKMYGGPNSNYAVFVGTSNANNAKVEISSCLFDGFKDAAVYSQPAGTGKSTSDITVNGTTISGCGMTMCSYAQNTIFTNNTVTGGSEISFAAAAEGADRNNTYTITGNIFQDVGKIWFYDADLADVTFTKNQVLGNTTISTENAKTDTNLNVSENYWGGNAPGNKVGGSNITGSNVYYVRPTMQPSDLNTYVPPTTGGGSSSSGDYLVNVNKVTGGKITVTPGRADKGDTVTITVKPNDGYELDTLVVTDKNGNTVKLTDKGNGKYTFTMPGSQVTVNASFAKDSSSPVDSFLDVNTGAWYYDAVKYAVESGLMSGTGTYTFEPNTTLSRGMIAQMLYALEGKPSISSANNFTDVSSSDWYDKAASWAQSKGIITGYEDGRFGPNDPLTREQLALILYNYAKSEGHSTSTKADLSKFADGTSTSPWAQQAMSWAVGEGLLSGRGVNMLYPTGTATRAEVAQIMMNFCENVAK